MIAYAISWKRRLGLLCLSLVMVCAFIPATAFGYKANAATTIMAQGVSGDCTWTVDYDGHLLIKPTNGTLGALGTWSSPYHLPWYDYRDNIISVSFGGTVKAQTCNSMFYNFSRLTSINFKNLDCSEVKDMSEMFYGCKMLPSINLSSLDCSSVRDMSRMFSNCSNLMNVELVNIGNPNLTKLDSMFWFCSKLANVNFTGVNIGGFTTFSDMFIGCYEISVLTLKAGQDFTTDDAYLSDLPWQDSTGRTYTTTDAMLKANAARTSGNFTYTSLTKKDISDGYVTLPKTSYTYTSKAIRPKPTVHYGSLTLKEGRDYEVRYYDGLSVGHASVWINGMGLYKGSLYVGYYITAPVVPSAKLKSLSSASKKLTVKWKKASKVSGYQIAYSTSKKFAKNNKYVTVKGASKVSKKITKLKSKRKYYVKIRAYKSIGGTKFYSAWSNVKSKKTK